MSSIFTKIIKGEIPSYKIDEDDNYFAFLDIRPMSKGHTLVVPKREEDYIFDLTDDELSGILPFSKRIAKAIEQVVDCKRIGISVVGLEVPHAHVHLIPINSVADMTFMKDPVEMSEDEFEALAGEIRAQL